MKGSHARKRALARDLRAQGLTVTAIAERLEIPRSTVGDMVKGVACIVELTCEVCGESFTFDRATRRASRACPRPYCQRVLRARITLAMPSYQKRLKGTA